jgi:DNA-binding transcriptional MerR regulator
MAIDELARQAGMTVRNVRAHQTRGLLPPPEIRGRTGYYGPEHLARLRLIKDMQEAGFNLGAIKSLLDVAPPGTAEELLRFERALMEPWGGEKPEVLDLEEVMAAFGHPSGEVVRRATRLGLLAPLEDGRVEVRHPTLLRVGRQLAEVGIPPERMIETLEALFRHADAISRSFVDLFLQGVWRPFEERGMPPEELPAVRRALEQLPPLGSQALSAAFNATMRRAVEETFGRELERRSASGEQAG